jgi:hypothetical protein
MNIKDMVSNNKKVKFIQYREGEFIYSTECGFEFPVPIADVGKATLLAEDKALLFLRYIRKHVEVIEAGSRTKIVGLNEFSTVIKTE